MIVTKCRLCSGQLSDPLLVLPPTPLANEFVSEPIQQDLFSLELVSCNECHHYQLTESISGERLFKQYAFVSGTSKVNVAHFTKLAEDTVAKFNLKPGDFVVEIASNDGTLLQAFKNLGMKVLGIDPAENIAKIANENGIETLPEFFTSELAETILNKYGQPKVILCNNCLAHTDYVVDILNGVNRLLQDGGVFIFENSYFKDMYTKILPDLIYSEHISHFLVIPLGALFFRLGMCLYDIENLSVHGGSIRGFVSKKHIRASQNLNKLIWEEVQLGLTGNLETKRAALKIFDDKIKELGTNLTIRLKEIKAEGKSIAIFGMPAKATTLLYAFNIDPKMIDFAVDDAVLKQGTFSPGKHIPVFAPEEIYKRWPNYILILAWNFQESIRYNHQKYLSGGGTFIVPLPIISLPDGINLIKTEVTIARLND